jgi:hypothetical protein
MPTMPAALLAVLLLTATVDPRLAEPLRLLADVQAVIHNTVGEPIGPMLANRARSSLVTIVVEPVDSGAFVHYNRTTRTITVSEFLASDDPRVVASALAHELQHSLDIDMALFGVVPGDCLTVEARGFATQAVVGRAVYGDELPRATEHERDLAVIVRRYERLGVDGYRAWLAEDPSYRQTCEALDAETR